MSNKSDWLKAYLASRSGDIKIKHEDTGIAWAGFWIGLGIVLAAQVVVTHQAVLK